MPAIDFSVLELVERGDMKNLDDQWLAAMEHPDQHRDDMLAALQLLTKDGKHDRAQELGSTWLAAEKERSESADVLPLAREIAVRCKDPEPLREELATLYEEVHADRAELAALIEQSGLRGGKTIRRALRTMEICLHVNVGDYVIARSDEHAGQVTAINPDTSEYTVKTRRGEETLDPDSLGLNYDRVDETDFRVLKQLNPERIADLLKNDPATLIIGLLKSQQGHMDSDHLEHLLTPAFMPPGQWKTWWTKAKTALKRSKHVVMEGKNPVILSYDSQGQTLEDEIEPQWKQAETPLQRLAIIDLYFREAKARKTEIKSAMVEQFHKDLVRRVKVARKGAPDEALQWALVLKRLGETSEIPAEEAAMAREILLEVDDLGKVLARIKSTPALYVRALPLVQEARPDDWFKIFAELLPVAPLEACESIAEALTKGEHREMLAASVQLIPTDFNRHFDAVCWLWKSPKSVEEFNPTSPRELLPKLLEHLNERTISDRTSADQLRDTRTRLRSALSAGKYSIFKTVIKEMETGMASTIRRAVDRMDGLGQVVRSDLLRIIQDAHPLLWVKAKVDPWFDDTVLFTTSTGLAKREEELKYLTDVKMRENAIAIGEAASHGDLSENSEYKFALEERDLLRARVAQIQNELGLARTISAEEVSTDKVGIGTRVELASTDGQDRRKITILGPFEADLDNNILNYRAPLATQLKDQKVGDTVTLLLDTTEREYRVEAIENALA